ncbi:MAG: hypothetical protein R2939_08240 [Kofleriaceae bacterium]
MDPTGEGVVGERVERQRHRRRGGAVPDPGDVGLVDAQLDAQLACVGDLEHGLVGRHHLARLDVAPQHHAGDGRGDLAFVGLAGQRLHLGRKLVAGGAQVEPRRSLGVVGGVRLRGQGRDLGARGVELLLSHRAAGHQLLGALQLGLRQRQLRVGGARLRLEAGELRRAAAGLGPGAAVLGLAARERQLTHRVLDPGEELAGGHQVAGLDRDRLDVLADAGLDDDGVERLDGAGGVDRLHRAAARDGLGMDLGRPPAPVEHDAEDDGDDAGEHQPANQVTRAAHARLRCCRPRTGAALAWRRGRCGFTQDESAHRGESARWS